MNGVTNDLYKKLGFSQRIGFGERPALILIDFNYNTTDPEASPIGFDQSEAIYHSQRLLELARLKGIPVVFTTLAFTDGFADAGVYLKKFSPSIYRNMVLGNRGVQIDGRLKPRPEEPIIVKKSASSFFGTNLASILTALRVDTTILVGNSTSGCVRATCTDSCQYGFRTIVPRECVADRALDVHEANLFDMDSKFADVVSVEEVLTYLQHL
jgi:maleamate amidohydrolase